MKPRRKVAPLTLAQAYTIRNCERGSALYNELLEDWRLYKSGDKTVLEKYGSLFAGKHNPQLPFVGFQQMVLRDKVGDITEEERIALDELINTRFETETNHRERLWQALKTDESQLDVDLE